MSNSAPSSSGVGLMSMLGLLFIGLKLAGVIDWSWWWVLAPFWGQAAVVVIILGFALLIAALAQAKPRPR